MPSKYLNALAALYLAFIPGEWSAQMEGYTFASSVYDNRETDYAVDGIEDGGKTIQYCFRSAIKERWDFHWWMIELDRHYEIKSVLFQLRT